MNLSHIKNKSPALTLCFPPTKMIKIPCCVKLSDAVNTLAIRKRGSLNVSRV